MKQTFKFGLYGKPEEIEIKKACEIDAFMQAMRFYLCKSPGETMQEPDKLHFVVTNDKQSRVYFIYSVAWHDEYIEPDKRVRNDHKNENLEEELAGHYIDDIEKVSE